MDVTIKGLPNGIQAQEVKEWVSVLVARKLEAEVKPQIDAALKPAQESLDVFRKANSLAAKFEAVEEELVESVEK
jgi:hypothetical protein